MPDPVLITYDPEVDAAYVYLAGPIRAGGVTRTVVATDDINLDFDGEGRLLGIEILGRSLLHPLTLARAVPPGSLDGDATH
jgi:uncharacterized protein YuzE